jgi:hypothetical protein
MPPMSAARERAHAGAMKPEKWVILGALAGLAAIAVNKQMRINRHRLEEQQPDVEARSSIDDVPTVQPATASFATVEAVDYLDERVAPAAPL